LTAVDARTTVRHRPERPVSMRSRTVLAILALLASLQPSTAEERAAAAFARQAPTDRDQCQVLVTLCHAAVVAGARASTTPWSSRTDNLIYSQDGKTALAVRDAHDAARVIEERHGGRRLPCFDHPECKFLGMPATEPPPRDKR
jgi:hypothetical protein